MEKTKETKKFDLTGAIIDFESGNLSEAGTIELFQYLVDTGLAWSLQGSYGRAAKAMIDAGLVSEAKPDYVPGPFDSTAIGSTKRLKPKD